MKMIMAIVEDQFSDATSQALINSDFRVTRLASTGGFFREGSTTLMVGVKDDLLKKAIQIIRDQIPPSKNPDEINATIYVLNVKDFRRV
jgi:uncharacterized protein YaaQ